MALLPIFQKAVTRFGAMVTINTNLLYLAPQVIEQGRYNRLQAGLS